MMLKKLALFSTLTISLILLAWCNQSWPKTAVDLYNAGMIKYDAGNYKKAIEDFDKAIELDPKNAEIYNERAAAKHGLKDYSWAIADYSTSIELEPTNARTYNSRWLWELYINQKEAGCADLKKAATMWYDSSKSIMEKYCN